MRFLSGDPRRLEQLQLKQTPLIHCRYVVIAVQINGKNGAPCIFNPNPHEEFKQPRICSLVWNRTLFLYKRSARYCIIFVVKDSCWAGCPVAVWTQGSRVRSLTLTFPPPRSEHQQLLHTETQLDTTPWYSSQTQRLNVHLCCVHLILLV